MFISKNPHPDRRHLANLVTTHRLTALNTWSRLSRAFTYEHENAQSQIDFFFAREAQIDGLARQAKLDHCFHLLRWRGGARHHPIAVSVPAIHYQTAPSRLTDTLTRAPRYQIDQPLERITAFQAALATQLDTANTPDALDQALQHAATHLIPAKAAPRGASVAERVQGTVKDMWYLRRAAQQHAADVLRPFTVVAQAQHWRRTGERLWFSLAQLFAAWRHQAAFLRQHDVLRRQGRRAKRDMLNDQLQQAWDADRQGDKSAIWQVIRRLAPKTAKTRVQLRGPQGELLTPQEETDRFVAYCQKVYHAPPEPAASSYGFGTSQSRPPT